MIIVDVKTDGTKKIVAFPKYHNEAVFYKRSGKLVKKQKIMIDGWEFFPSGIVNVLNKELLREIIEKFAYKSVTVEPKATMVVYNIDGHEVKITRNGSMTFDGIDVNSIDDVIWITGKNEEYTTNDPLLSDWEMEFRGEKIHVLPKESSAIPSSYIFSKKEYFGGLKIKTSDGFKKLKFRPVFVRPVSYLFGETLIDSNNAPNIDFIVPGMTVSTKYGVVEYEDANMWAIRRTDGKYFERIDDDIVWSCEEEFPHGVSRDCFYLNGTKYWKNVSLSTGQKVLAASIWKNKVRLYGLATGEGLFVADVDPNLLEENKPLSVFDEGISVVGAFYTLPIKIPIKNSSTWADIFPSTGYTIMVKIDGKNFPYACTNYSMYRNYVMKALSEEGIKRSHYDEIIEYGLIY